MLRIEAGFILAGADFLPAAEAIRPTHTRSPFELGLGWLVSFDKGVFNGRQALLEEKQNGSRFHLVKLDIDGNKPANQSFVYTKGKKYAGTVTSAMWSPSAKASIALASLEAPLGKPGEEFEVEIYYQRELKWSRVMAPARRGEGRILGSAAQEDRHRPPTSDGIAVTDLWERATPAITDICFRKFRDDVFTIVRSHFNISYYIR